MLLQKLYYALKPLIPRSVQLYLRRVRIRILRKKYPDLWPIYHPAAGGLAAGIKWPDRKQFALLLTHDVEGPVGRDRCGQLLALEKKMGFRSAFYFVPRRYEINPILREYITEHGFEVGVHGLYHDGKLYNSDLIFQQRLPHINNYLKQWKACGFSSPCAQHNLEWNTDLDVRYAITTYDTDPFEPQGGGIGTIFPFRIRNCQTGREYIEIPYTLPQDFSLYVLMKEKTIAIWKQKLDWIAKSGGMVHLKTHPDYMCFDDAAPGSEQYPLSYYLDFLRYLKLAYDDQYWHVCPNELSDFCFQNASPIPCHEANGNILSQSCRTQFENKKILAFGVSGNDFIARQ